MNNTRSHGRGQIAMQFQLAMWIFLIFITIILAAEYAYFPQITEKVENKTQNAINIYRCSVIDVMAVWKTQGITINESNGTCLAKTEKQYGKFTRPNFEEYRELG